MFEQTTREVMTRYWESEHTDVSMMADGVMFTMLATGESYRGPEAVQQMLHYIYHVAFDAQARPRNTLVFDGHALWEGHFVGKHIGEFAGVPSTGKEVCVPLCVVYDLEADKIAKARIYFEVPVLLEQVGAR
jgi:predicted ester cyclase